MGRLDFDYAVQAGGNPLQSWPSAFSPMRATESGYGEKIVLDGEQARGLIKTRIALEDESSAEVTGITEGNAAGARGHVDCTEIVKDKAIAKAIRLCMLPIHWPR